MLNLISFTLRSLLLAFSVAASPVDIAAGSACSCATHLAADAVIFAEETFAINKVQLALGAKAPIINIYWHVVSKDKTVAGGYIPDSQIKSQIKTLNDDYAGGMTWNLLETTRTINAGWFDGAGPNTSQQSAMKAALRKGGKGDLNVFSVGFTKNQGLLGYATFPSSVSSYAKDDGVVILFSTVPGGSLKNSNLGRTLTHEAGHWVGLYHTFQGGCAGSNSNRGGDYVSDTRPEESPAYGCPTGRNTCPDMKIGEEPTQNFMDYTDDACMKRFSSGQMTRALEQLATYRGITGK
ncbi:metalloprotease [Mycena rebaudengoi]|nr:metalloprotease [Mycena rebaudengoi]